MEKDAEILCYGIHYTRFRVQQTKNKRLFLCKVAVFVQIASLGNDIRERDVVTLTYVLHYVHVHLGLILLPLGGGIVQAYADGYLYHLFFYCNK